MYKSYIVLLVSAILLNCNCSSSSVSADVQQRLLTRRGFGEMKKRLKPTILNCDGAFGVYGLNIKNTLATVNKEGEFCLLTIGQSGDISIKPVKPGFPDEWGQKYFTDSEHNMMWMTYGRGFYALDITSGAGAKTVVSARAKEWILDSCVIDPQKKIMLIEVTSRSPVTFRYVLWDLTKDKIIFENPGHKGSFFPINPSKMLFCEYNEANIKKWQFVTPDFKKLKATNLTKKLNTLQINISNNSKSYHYNKRIMLGATLVGTVLTYYSIRWDEKGGKVKVEPVILQRPKNIHFSTKFEFSPDGEWVKTLAYHKPGSKQTPPELVIFKTGTNYPQGLSMPIHCGYTQENNKGAFMNHDKWGPCYVEFDEGRLFVFKLNEGMDIIRKEMSEMPGMQG